MRASAPETVNRISRLLLAHRKYGAACAAIPEPGLFHIGEGTGLKAILKPPGMADFKSPPMALRLTRKFADALKDESLETFHK